MYLEEEECGDLVEHLLSVKRSMARDLDSSQPASDLNIDSIGKDSGMNKIYNGKLICIL